MKEIFAKNSTRKSVQFFDCGNGYVQATAMQDGEYWFSIGTYKSLKSAETFAIKKMTKYGYEF